MHNRSLYTPGLKLLIFAGILLLNSCTAPTGKSTPDTPAIPVVEGVTDKNHQSASTPDIPLACSAALLRPAKFTTRNERILVFEPAPEFENIPATIDWGIKRIQVEPARYANETVPAQYREETEQVAVLRERDELKGLPAVYKTTDRPVTITPGHIRWKSNCTDRQNPPACFERVPAKTKLLKQQTIDIPNQVIQKRLPAKTVQVTKKVLVKPGQGTGPIIPARYIDVKVGKVARVWEIKSIHKPFTKPRFKTVQVQIKSREDQIRKRPVLCSTADSETIRKVQSQLRKRGFPASLTGQLDNQSMKALTQFQQANDLFIGAVSAETLTRLGLK